MNAQLIKLIDSEIASIEAALIKPCMGERDGDMCLRQALEALRRIRTEASSAMRPLFISLKREYFERFRDGTKSVEFRPYGPRWNYQTCGIGRRVTLSLGFGNAHRLAGIITSFRTDTQHETIPGWAECYGKDDKRTVACIGITLL